MYCQSDGETEQVEAVPPAEYVFPEVGWLLAALLTPLVVNLWARQPFEPSKAALFRSIAWIIAGLWLCSGLLCGRRLWREVSGHRLFWLVVAVAAVQAIATLLSVDCSLSLWGSTERAQGALTLLSYSLLFLVVSTRLRTLAQAQRLAAAIAITGLPLMALGAAQALGWAPLALITDARSPIYATLGRANFLGAYLAMLLPVTLALCICAHGRPLQTAGAALLASEGVLIILTDARGAWLAAAVAAALFGLVWFQPRPAAWSRRHRAIAAGACGLVAAASLALALWTGASGGSASARLTIWRATLQLVSRRPLLGYGPETLELVFPQVYPPELVYTQGRGVLIDRAHNVLLDWAVTSGAAGVATQVALLGVFFAMGWRAARRAADRRERALLAGCLAAVGGNVGGNLVSFDVTTTAAATALLMAMVVALARRQEPDPGEMPGRKLPRPAALAAALLIAAGIAAAIWACNVRPIAADVAARAADQRAAAGDWKGAIAAGQRAVALWPVDPAYRRALSWAAMQRAILAGAEAEPWLRLAESELLAARDLRPGEHRTWAALGELYGVWGNHWDPAMLPLAQEAFARAVSLAPHQATLYAGWGMVELAGGRFDPAMARFRQAVDLDATDGYAFAHLGEAELAAGRIDEAAAAYGQAVRWAPRLTAAHLGLARCYWLQGRREAAAQALERALELDPEQPGALALRREMDRLP